MIACLVALVIAVVHARKAMLKKHDPSQQRVVVRVRDASVDVDALAHAHGMANLGEMMTLPRTLPTGTLCFASPFVDSAFCARNVAEQKTRAAARRAGCASRVVRFSIEMMLIKSN